MSTLRATTEPGRENDSFSQRMRSAAMRASGGALEVKRVANKLSEELDEVTAPHGVPVTELSDEDSAVRAIVDILPSKLAVGTGRGRGG